MRPLSTQPPSTLRASVPNGALPAAAGRQGGAKGGGKGRVPPPAVPAQVMAMLQRLRAGVIWSNAYNKFDPTSPFGGVRESGFGREGGMQGLEGYLNV